MNYAARWLLTAAPLLTLLGWMWLTLGDEPAVAAHYRELRAADPGLTATLKLVTDWGNKVFYAIFAGLLLWGWRSGRRRWVRFALTYVVVQALLAFALVNASKFAIGKPRPGVDGPFLPFSMKASHAAWPSGHTAEVTGSATSLGLAGGLLLSLLAGLVIALMGYTRIYLGWHHVGDVLMGWVVGSFGGAVITAFGWHRQS